jgi:hypothetical protein
LIPPLLHYHSTDERESSTLDIWGPVYRYDAPDTDSLHVFPFYYSKWGQNERHTTLAPFFHYGYEGDSHLLVTPLFMTAKGDHGESTFASWLYARYRGRTELDMITPLYWDYRDPDAGVDQKLLFPFFYRRTSPRQNDWLVFPLGGHFERYGISETTWVTPFFQYSHDLRGWSTAIHPIFYIGRSGRDSHTVLAPFFWDFSSPSSRSTVGFPLYWRFSSPDSVDQLVGNVFYSEKRVKQGLDWQVHVFPFFSYGETPDGHWWNVLYGLAGYTRRGDLTKLRTLWIPITLSGDD